MHEIVGFSSSAWPMHDDYNKDFKTINDYSDWVRTQAQTLPDFDTYQKTWIQQDKNRVLMADLRDAVGFLIRQGSQYLNTEAEISQLIASLDTRFPKKSDYEALVSNLQSLWPEADGYDAGFTKAEDYLDYLSNQHIPQDAPDFAEWINGNKQLLADIINAAGKLTNIYHSDYSPSLQKIVDDAVALSESGVSEADLTKVSLDLQYFYFDKGFTTADQYQTFLKNAMSGYDPAHYQEWVEKNGMLIEAAIMAAEKLANVYHVSNSSRLERFSTDLGILAKPDAQDSDAAALACDLKYYDYDQGFSTASAYTDFIQGVLGGWDLDHLPMWLRENGMLLDALNDAVSKLIDTYHSPYSANLSESLKDFQAVSGPDVQKSDLMTVLQDLRYYDYDQGFTTEDQYRQFIVSALGQASFDDPKEFVHVNAMVLKGIADAVGKMIDVYHDTDPSLSGIRAQASNLLANPDAQSNDLAAFYESIYTNLASFTDDQSIAMLSNLSKILPQDPSTFADWIPKNQDVMRLIGSAVSRLTQNQNLLAKWDNMANLAQALMAPGCSPDTLAWMEASLGSIGVKQFPDQTSAMAYLQSLNSQFPHDANTWTPEQALDWIAKNRAVVEAMVNQAAYTMAKFPGGAIYMGFIQSAMNAGINLQKEDDQTPGHIATIHNLLWLLQPL